MARMSRRWNAGILVCSALLSARAEQSVSGQSLFANSTLAEGKSGVRIRAVSWNVAAVNNNPFEYWITHPNPKYKELMDSIETFILNPGKEDVRVDEVFTPALFQKLMEQLRKAGVSSLEPILEHWESLRKEGIVSGFLKNAAIGKKRLVSMPDRVSNTIQLASGEFQFRPTVINCYPEDVNSVEEWWAKWLTFFFETPVEVGKGTRTVFSMLQKIKKAKYPAITEEEEKISIPLQVVYVAVFDAILVHVMNAKGGGFWQGLRSDICVSLNVKKSKNLLAILQTTYRDADVIFLQEAGNQLVELLRGAYAASHWLALPGHYNMKRNQNSVILLSKSMFSKPAEIEADGSAAAGLEAGDLLILKSTAGGGDAKLESSKTLALASFHGDTNGLLTEAALGVVLDALRDAAVEPLLFGLDANTYELESSSTAHVLKWESAYLSKGLQSSFGAVDPTRHTTFNARTYMQPQLNKAASSSELKAKGDKNPKDFILATGAHFSFGNWWRDNTGVGKYEEELVFPTLQFPSDHAVMASEVLLLSESEAKTEL